MNLHTLSNVKGARSRRVRVGRGESSGLGKTCGKGNKGQMSRTGHKRKATFEGGQMRLVRRIPKRGFTSPNRAAFAPVNVADLDLFPADTEITVALLRQAGLVKGAAARVKILGAGELKGKFAVKAHAFSASARAKIEAVGGKCEVIA